MGDAAILQKYLLERVDKKPSRIPIAVSRQCDPKYVNGDTSNVTPANLTRSKSFSTGSLNKLQTSTSFREFIAKRGFEESVNDAFTMRRDVQHAGDALNLSFCGSVCSSTSSVRETNTSRKRFEINHAGHDRTTDSYMTPTQRKNEQIRELRARVRDLVKRVGERDEEISGLKADVELQVSAAIAAKNDELETTRDKFNALYDKTQEMRVQNADLGETVSGLRKKLELLKDTLETREREHETGLLQMYQKGMTIAQRQREDELQEHISMNDKKAAITMHELMDKLSSTEKSLSKWQSIRRQESYTEALFAPTEAEATLRFLRDSFYHYLTSPSNADDHLRAMIRIFSFTEVQLKKIAKSITKGKKK